MKECFEPCTEEIGNSPRATSRCLAAAVRIVYGGTPSSKINVNPARKELSEFLAHSHQKLSSQFFLFQRETGDFMTDLACKLSGLIQSSQDAKVALEGECKKKGASLVAWKIFYERHVPARTRYSISHAVPT